MIKDNYFIMIFFARENGVCKNFTFSSLLVIYVTVSSRGSLKLYVSDIFETVTKSVLSIVDIFA